MAAVDRIKELTEAALESVTRVRLAKLEEIINQKNIDMKAGNVSALNRFPEIMKIIERAALRGESRVEVSTLQNEDEFKLDAYNSSFFTTLRSLLKHEGFTVEESDEVQRPGNGSDEYYDTTRYFHTMHAIWE